MPSRSVNVKEAGLRRSAAGTDGIEFVAVERGGTTGLELRAVGVTPVADDPAGLLAMLPGGPLGRLMR